MLLLSSTKHPRAALSAGIHPEAVDNLIVRKPELKPEGGPKCKKRAIDQQPTIEENSKFLCIHQRDTLPALPAKLLDPLCSHVLPRSQANVLDSLKVSLEQASNIERETKDQSQNPFWHELRKRRLTASKFK